MDSEELDGDSEMKRNSEVPKSPKQQISDGRVGAEALSRMDDESGAAVHAKDPTAAAVLVYDLVALIRMQRRVNGFVALTTAPP